MIITLHENQYLKLLRYKLWVKNPHCVYCGVETVMPLDIIEMGLDSAPNMATIDHEYSKLNPLRYSAQQKYYLCCNLCNGYRAQLEESKLSIEELRIRSRRGHRNSVPQPIQEIAIK